MTIFAVAGQAQALRRREENDMIEPIFVNVTGVESLPRKDKHSRENHNQESTFLQDRVCIGA